MYLHSAAVSLKKQKQKKNSRSTCYINFMCLQQGCICSLEAAGLVGRALEAEWENEKGRTGEFENQGLGQTSGELDCGAAVFALDPGAMGPISDLCKRLTCS